MNNSQQQSQTQSLPKQHENDTTMTTTTIREIRSTKTTIGSSLSPALCQANSAAAGINLSSVAMNSNLNHHQQAIERRQAISMERLNSIHSPSNNRGHIYGPANGRGSSTLFLHHRQRDKENTNLAASGSLSSGSNSSLDDLSASDDHQPQPQPQPTRATGLTRSASRVSRFKSAKEFFERLSSIQSNGGGGGGCTSSSSQTSPAKFERSPILERPQRAVVLTRYAPASVALPAQNTKPTTANLPQKSITITSSNCNNINNNNNNTINSPPRSRLPPPAAAAPFLNRINQSQQPASGPPKRPENNNNNITTTTVNSNSSGSSSTLDNRTAHDAETLPKLTTTSSSSSSHNDSSSSCDDTSSSSGSGNELCDDVMVVFSGSHVIVGNGSLLNRRNKQLRIKFDENNPTTTFEYPSEEAMLAEPDSPPRQSLPDHPANQQSADQQQQQQPASQELHNNKSKLQPLSRVMTKLIMK